MRKRTKQGERWSDEEHDQEQKEEHKVREQRVFLNCAYPETFFFCCPSATLALFSPRRLKLEILRLLKAKGVTGEGLKKSKERNRQSSAVKSTCEHAKAALADGAWACGGDELCGRAQGHAGIDTFFSKL